MIRINEKMKQKLQAQLPAYFLAGCMFVQTIAPGMVYASRLHLNHQNFEKLAGLSCSRLGWEVPAGQKLGNLLVSNIVSDLPEFPLYCNQNNIGIGTPLANDSFSGGITVVRSSSLGSLPGDPDFRQLDKQLYGNLLAGNTLGHSSKLDSSLPGGPDQPEVQSFSPVGTDNMVDPFTGDFSYNIPLMDVDGYPINMAYSAGVTMDQEATWVGLGWSLNPGVINRHLRGLPDDFSGDPVVKEFNKKKNWTVGVNVGGSIETVAFEGLGIAASLGINYNNYTGFASEIMVSPSFSISGNLGNMGASLGISSNSQTGASVSPGISLSRAEHFEGASSISKGINVGTSINSRSGLSNITVGYTRSVGQKQAKYSNKNESTFRGNSVGSSSAFNVGMTTHTPKINMPLNSYAFTARFKLGPDAIGLDGTVDIGGYFSSQWLKEKIKSEQAFGYMNLAYGQANPAAMMDYNRENDGSYTKLTPALPVPALTYDIYSVSGHGVSGSYRAYRNDIGHVFDPKVTNNSVSNSVGGEVGLGATFKAGIDVSGTNTSMKTKPWTDQSNAAAAKMRYSTLDVQFREANELSIETDPDHFDKIGGSNPVRFRNAGSKALQNVLENNQSTALNIVSDYKKTGTDKRNQVLYTLSSAELNQGMGIESVHPQAFGNGNAAVGHHIGQFTTLTTEGARYVYGIAAYSHFQENVSFAVGAPDGLIPTCSTGLVEYGDSDASINNSKGTDNHYTSEKLPPFAHSYLLTSVLNSDYVDADSIKGPSKGDLGGYLRFDYRKIDNYKWRNPVNENEAFFDEGLNADKGDDKANFIYGEKELWYVNTISSKNHIAVFYTSGRSDGKSVNGRHGGLPAGVPDSLAMQKLDSIKLYTLPDYEADPINAVPIKTVHFEYDYSLCQGYDQNNDTGTLGGKLTLKKVYMTYEKSQRGRHSVYEFNYGYNPNYDIKSVDRWGNYKPKPASCTNDILTTDLRPSDFPYVGYDKANVDQLAGSWALTSINLPSGGRIEVDYESDDYAYVQHKRAHQMFKIIGVEGQSPGNPVQDISSHSFENKPIYFEMIPGTSIHEYGKKGDQIYFRALMHFGGIKYDFVPGWSVIEEITTGTYNGVACGKLLLQPAKLKDSESAIYHPISVAAIQFGRIHLARILPPSEQNSITGEGPVFLDIAQALAGAFTNFGELITGPNKPLWSQNIGTHLVCGKSWVRLQNPNRKKLGGGHRVKEVRMYDAWDAISGSGQEMYYGQTYEYNLPDGSSSGVASYEPQIGGDENVWRTPIANDIAYTLAPDIRNYQETPFGEQFFPTPSVGYSKVTVKNLERQGVVRTATGKVVHEFYTAKDYPTIASRTSIKSVPYKSQIFAIFFARNIDEVSASQGFVVENNDMHGKQKAQQVYQEGKNDPISKVEYFYQDEPTVIDKIAARHLVNEVQSIRKNGTVTTSVVGRTYEAVADFRSASTSMIHGSVDVNLNYTNPIIVLPMVLGTGTQERTEFRSAAFVKTIERKGILTRTVATDLGSKVETNNLAYDAETGAVLLTQTTTDFNDKVYSFSYPAHWYYNGMGQAYRNVGYTRTAASTFSGGVTSALNATMCVPGDEVGIMQGGVLKLGWITDVTANSAKVVLKDGSPVIGTADKIKILRSGRKNLQNTSIGTIAMRENPLNGLTTNVLEKILQAGSVEFVDEWGTFCECFVGEGESILSANPYVAGIKGNWRPKASYLHLSGRTQTYENANSNIREDGVFTSFTPFYKLDGGNWAIDRQNWTYTSSVTEFGPFGQSLEAVDALNRYSSSQYGYNQTLVTAASTNSRYRQLGFDGFEDYDFENCSDNHFKVATGEQIVSDRSHSGRRSLKVPANTDVTYTAIIVDDCEEEFVCRLAAEIDSSGMQRGFTVVGGTAPYQYDLNVTSGFANLVIGSGGFLVTSTLGGTVSEVRYTVTVTDANGCRYQSEQVINE